MILWIRQISFNICFYGFTLVYSIFLSLFLVLPRSIYFPFLQFYFDTLYEIEKHILGLDFEVRGAEYLPKEGSFLVAAKHQSAYETFKMHILFKDPAIIHKRELAMIPFFGWHMWKSEMIAIDRKSGETARRAIIDGTLRMKATGRPIVIFPQGTRVGINDSTTARPYKNGIIRMQEASGLPIVPLALNSGVYWPKHAFFKKPGKIVFEFLPPIPAGLPQAEVSRKMSDEIENHSAKLVAEAWAEQ